MDPTARCRTRTTPIGRPESALADYLEQGRQILTDAEPCTEPTDSGELVAAGLVRADFDHLRWFDLPPMSLR